MQLAERFAIIIRFRRVKLACGRLLPFIWLGTPIFLSFDYAQT